MAKNPLLDLEKYGQSIWLDYISRELIDSGHLLGFIKEDHLKGLTSNPSIFEKAIGKTNDYDEIIEAIIRKDPQNAKAVYENIAIKDIQDAADILRPVYENLKGADGFVSLEVSPHLAFDTKGSIEEAKRLWHLVDRPNLMIKLPGTAEGISATRELISLGINVNVTLLFSIDAYRDAALAYLAGLKTRAEKGFPIDSVHSVASFFVSRIDSLIDEKLEKIIEKSPNTVQARRAKALLGAIAIANAKTAYLLFEEIYKSDDTQTLLRQGAKPQRLLWASTSSKNKHYRDVIYVEALIGKNTVITLPPATLDAFRDHGHAANSIKEDIFNASHLMAELSALGIDFRACCEQLLVDGLGLFIRDFDQLLSVMEEKLSRLADRT